MRSKPSSLACSASPDSRHPHPRVWLFDLDNTLHNAGAHIFPQIHQAMVDYIACLLNIDETEASRLREFYWRRYGATLLGLIRHHNIDPRHFLHHTHQFPDLERQVITERGLKTVLHRLPGRKIVFSNAPLIYTEAVLAIAGIRQCFDAIYTVERLRFQPKPAMSGFLRVLRDERLDPRSCIMVEDTLDNLRTAKRLGMRTVWVSTCTRRSPCVDVKVRTVMDLPKRLGRL